MRIFLIRYIIIIIIIITGSLTNYYFKNYN